MSFTRAITKDNLEDVVSDQLEDLGLKLELYMSEGAEGSGWKLRRLPRLFLKIHKVRLPKGASYIPTPPNLNNSKCGLMTIRNDQECFR